MKGPSRRPPGHVPLNRALSKLGIASRAEATRLIVEGRVSLDGRVVRDPDAPVVPERAQVAIDGQPAAHAPWRLILLNKPRGVMTTRRDPLGRPTVFDLVSGVEGHLVAVGRLDLATSGLLLLTTDTRLADWLTDPSNRVPRVYTVTVRGEVSDEAVRSLTKGIDIEGGRMAADEVTVRKRSRRETHLVVRLHEGRNRENPAVVRCGRARGDQPPPCGLRRDRARVAATWRMARHRPVGVRHCIPACQWCAESREPRGQSPGPTTRGRQPFAGTR